MLPSVRDPAGSGHPTFLGGPDHHAGRARGPRPTGMVGTPSRTHRGAMDLPRARAPDRSTTRAACCTRTTPRPSSPSLSPGWRPPSGAGAAASRALGLRVLTTDRGDADRRARRAPRDGSTSSGVRPDRGRRGRTPGRPRDARRPRARPVDRPAPDPPTPGPARPRAADPRRKHDDHEHHHDATDPTTDPAAGPTAVPTSISPAARPARPLRGRRPPAGGPGVRRPPRPVEPRRRPAPGRRGDPAQRRRRPGGRPRGRPRPACASPRRAPDTGPVPWGEAARRRRAAAPLRAHRRHRRRRGAHRPGGGRHPVAGRGRGHCTPRPDRAARQCPRHRRGGIRAQRRPVVLRPPARARGQLHPGRRRRPARRLLRARRRRAQRRAVLGGPRGRGQPRGRGRDRARPPAVRRRVRRHAPVGPGAGGGGLPAWVRWSRRSRSRSPPRCG